MEKLSKTQLQEICKQKGIAYTANTLKSELIKLINETKTKAKISENPFRGEY